MYGVPHDVSFFLDNCLFEREKEREKMKEEMNLFYLQVDSSNAHDSCDWAKVKTRAMNAT